MYRDFAGRLRDPLLSAPPGDLSNLVASFLLEANRGRLDKYSHNELIPISPKIQTHPGRFSCLDGIHLPWDGRNGVQCSLPPSRAQNGLARSSPELTRRCLPQRFPSARLTRRRKRPRPGGCPISADPGPERIPDGAAPPAGSAPTGRGAAGRHGCEPRTDGFPPAPQSHGGSRSMWARLQRVEVIN